MIPSRRMILLQLLLLFSLSLYAETENCFKFFSNSFKIIDEYPAFAVDKNRYVSMQCPSDKKVILSDPFKGLCLFEDEASTPFLLGDVAEPLYICPNKKSFKWAIGSYPVSVFAGKLAEPPGYKGAIFSDCCMLAGLFDSDGTWFDAKSIRRLLNGKTEHGDVGARFVQRDGRVIVETVDPFSSCRLKSGDIILKANGNDRPTLQKVREMVDSCKNGEKFRFRVKRKKEILPVDTSCFNRFGGGKISDTFLERFGIRFSSSLEITGIDTSSISFKKGLKTGDRLLMIDGIRVKDEAGVRTLLSGYSAFKQTPENMLWERRGFQFFLLPTSL